MARKRATGRFYFLLILLLGVIAYFVFQQMPARSTEAMISSARSTDERTVDAVIIRDEQIVAYEGLEKVDFVADEGASVRAGDPIADIYTTSYIQKELSKLATTRENIRAYHQELFLEMNDPTLDRLDENVQFKALELKRLVTGENAGSLINLEAELAESMKQRQDYLSDSRLDDTKLMQLYQDENARTGSISHWKTSSTAPRSGVVSFYFDGYEDVLTAEKLNSLSAETLRKVLQGDTSVQTQRSKRSEQVYRVVSDDIWYVALISRDTSWSPVNGQSLSFQFEGFEDLTYSGTVVGVQRSGSDVIITLSCTDPIGPLLYQRAGRATVGIYTTGLSVPAQALHYENGQPGVWIKGNYGPTFIPVDILSQNNSIAIIQPMQSDALYEGQMVMIY
ncbi:MAG: HlyD family efflux transporter periplasmic adaptor subunit [Eubacteriales bacterium]|nr:HlyD family efflux transporter periplasmic adaptor subunit [Eubacteriales bacterium]